MQSMSSDALPTRLEPAHSPHVTALGIEIVERGPRRLVMRMPVRPEMVGNPDSGALFGGVIYTLIDTVCGFLAFESLEEPAFVATLDLRVDYLAAARSDQDVFAEAICTRVSRQVVFLRAGAWQSDPEQPIASALSTFMINRIDTNPGAGAA